MTTGFSRRDRHEAGPPPPPMSGPPGTPAWGWGGSALRSDVGTWWYTGLVMAVEGPERTDSGSGSGQGGGPTSSVSRPGSPVARLWRSRADTRSRRSLLRLLAAAGIASAFAV